MLAIAYTCGAASVGTASLIPAVLTPLPMVANTLQVADTLTLIPAVLAPFRDTPLIPAVLTPLPMVAYTLQVADTLTLIPAVLAPFRLASTLIPPVLHRSRWSLIPCRWLTR